MKKSDASPGPSASALISERIATLGGWRGETLARMRKLIADADPQVVEEWKWMGTPVWSHDGIVCTGESYKDKVKLTFAKGASLKDPAALFNSSLEGNTRRAIDILEGQAVEGRCVPLCLLVNARCRTHASLSATAVAATSVLVAAFAR